MKRFTILPLALLALTMMFMGNAQAQITVVHTIDYWFANANDATATPITFIDVALGESFDLAVWYKTSDPYPAFANAVFVGWDRTTTLGATAEPLDEKITNNLGNVGFIVDSATAFKKIMLNTVGGSRGDTGTSRYFGSLLSTTLEEISYTYQDQIINTTPSKIGVLSLKNAAIPVGQSYTIAIVTNLPSALSWSSYLSSASEVFQGGIYKNNELEDTTLIVNSTQKMPSPIVPEPATLAGLLVFAPALIAAARRKR